MSLRPNVRFYDAADSHQHDLGRRSWDLTANHIAAISHTEDAFLSLSRLVRLPPIVEIGQRREHHTTMKSIIIAVNLVN